MTKQEVFEKLLRSYEAYYNVNRTAPSEPFDAEAVFTSHTEEYFLIKEARITEMDSEEYVFFKLVDRLTLEELKSLEERVWNEALRRADPRSNHRSSDGVLIVIADHIDDDAVSQMQRSRRYKTYRFGMHGSSTLREIALENSTGELVCNRHGRQLVDILRNI